jgi:hypothetical protein
MSKQRHEREVHYVYRIVSNTGEVLYIGKGKTQFTKWNRVFYDRIQSHQKSISTHAPGTGHHELYDYLLENPGYRFEKIAEWDGRNAQSSAEAEEARLIGLVKPTINIRGGGKIGLKTWDKLCCVYAITVDDIPVYIGEGAEEYNSDRDDGWCRMAMHETGLKKWLRGDPPINCGHNEMYSKIYDKNWKIIKLASGLKKWEVILVEQAEIAKRIAAYGTEGFYNKLSGVGGHELGASKPRRNLTDEEKAAIGERARGKKRGPYVTEHKQFTPEQMEERKRLYLETYEKRKAGLIPAYKRDTPWSHLTPTQKAQRFLDRKAITKEAKRLDKSGAPEAEVLEHLRKLDEVDAAYSISKRKLIYMSFSFGRAQV